MRIEFGCGENPTKRGFLTCDIRNLPRIDFVCPAWEIESFVAKNSVKEIFSRHFFEHLTFSQGEKLLESWYNILEPGGVCGIMLPNMEFHIQQWIKGEDLNWCRAGFWGWQRGDFTDSWDVHKSGYNKNQLRDLLLSKNYKNIKSLYPEDSNHLYLEGVK